MRLLAALVVAASVLPAAAQDPAGPDVLILPGRLEVAGRIEAVEPDGTIVVKTAEGTRRLAPEDILRVVFDRAAEVKPAAGEKVRLQHGALLTGRVESYAAGRLKLVAEHGTYLVPRAELRQVVLAAPTGSVPEVKDGGKDVVFRQPEAGKKELRAAVGEIASIGADEVQVGDAKIPRAEVCSILFASGRTPEATAGWFARVQLRNGDRVFGTLRNLAGDRVEIFSHQLGTVRVEKKAVVSVSMAAVARMTLGNLLVCDQNGVRELDRAGKELWSFGKNVAYAWSARKLENGNVLISNPNMSQVLEIRPRERNGGDLVWSWEGAQYPYDAVKLENGNVLVADYYGNRVVEVNPKDNSTAWTSPRINLPISVERLPNGNTLVGTSQEVLEVDSKGATTWKAAVPGLRPWRASRLENGNTLIVENNRGQVIEIDAKSNVVWKRDGLSRPVQALRLDDGNTLILEQQRNHLLEVDAAGREVRTVGGLQFPNNVSMY